jgi:hypothetical protein
MSCTLSFLVRCQHWSFGCARPFHWFYTLRGPWPRLSVSWSFLQTMGPLGLVISSSQHLYLITGQHKHRINTYAHQTYMPCVGFEPTSEWRPLGYRDRRCAHCKRNFTECCLLQIMWQEKHSRPCDRGVSKFTGIESSISQRLRTHARTLLSRWIFHNHFQTQVHSFITINL